MNIKLLLFLRSALVASALLMASNPARGDFIATGGLVTIVGNREVHTFTSSGSLSVLTSSVNVE